jgi:hypothetical protein
MIRTTLALATASLFLVACDAKPAPEAPKPEAAATPGDADAAAAAKAMSDMAAAMSASGAGGANAPIANPQMRGFVESFEKVADIVATVKDQSSAKAVGDQLRPLMAKLDEQSKALDALPESEKAAISMQGSRRLMAAVGKMTSHMLSLPPDVQQTLSAELDKLPEPK